MKLSDLISVFQEIDSKWLMAGVVVLMTLVEITPIKINPWKFIGGIIGHYINGDVIDRLDEVDEKIKDVQKKQDDFDYKIKEVQETQDEMQRNESERNALNARIRILRFGSELRSGLRHTEEHFSDVMRDITEYEHYCNTHPDFKNEKAKMTIEHIRNKWKEHVDNNDFL